MEESTKKANKKRVIVGAGKRYKHTPAPAKSKVEAPKVAVIAQPKADPKAAVSQIEANAKAGIKRTEITWPGNKIAVVVESKDLADRNTTRNS